MWYSYFKPALSQQEEIETLMEGVRLHDPEKGS